MSTNKQIVGIALGIMFSLTGVHASPPYPCPDKSLIIKDIDERLILMNDQDTIVAFIPEGEMITTQNPWTPNGRFFVTVKNSNILTIWAIYPVLNAMSKPCNFKIRSAYFSSHNELTVESIDGERSVIDIPAQIFNDNLPQGSES